MKLIENTVILVAGSILIIGGLVAVAILFIGAVIMVAFRRLNPRRVFSAADY